MIIGTHETHETHALCVSYSLSVNGFLLLLWSKFLHHPPELECSNSNTSCTVKMGSSSMSEYIQSVKSIVDNLEAVANPVADSDLVSTLLSSLSPKYNLFVTSVNTRVDRVLSEELIILMLS